jgi:hypothetical protein
MAALARKVGMISVPNRLTVARAVGAQAEWWFKWGLTRLMGETRYHNLRHLVRSRGRAA